MAHPNKPPVPVLLTEKLKYELPRETWLKHIPLLGNRLPVGSFIAKSDERKREGKIQTDIDFLGNSALNLTSDLHLLMLLAGGWDDQIEKLVEEVGKSLFNKQGFFSAEALKTGQSSLGPKIAGDQFAVDGLNQQKHFLTVSDLLSVFEMDGDSVRTQHQKRIDIVNSLLGGGALALLGEGGLALQGEITKTVATDVAQQPWMTTAEVAGGAGMGIAGAVGGLLINKVGNAISARLRDGEELPRIIQTLTPLITGITGLVGGKALVDGLFETTKVPITSLEQGLLQVPIIALTVGGAIGVGAISRKIHSREQDAISAEVDRIKRTGRVDMLLAMANSMGVLQKLKKWGDSVEVNNVNGPRQELVTRTLQEWDPELTDALRTYNPRHPESLAAIRDLAPSNLLKLSERLLIMDTLAAYTPPASLKADGLTANTIAVGILPGPDKLFANLDRGVLNTLGSDTANFIKQRAVKSPIAALSAFSPTLSFVMLGQGNDSKGGLGAADDSRHYGFAGMNFGIRSDIVDMVSASLSKIGTVGDPGRAIMTAQMKNLGALYKESIPVEGLELIYKEPAYARLAVMGSIAFSKAQETKQFRGDLHALEQRQQQITQELAGKKVPNKRELRKTLQTVELQLEALKKGESTMGSKGLLSDVGDAIINGMEKNPMVGYLVLSDITNAIKLFSSQELFPALGGSTRSNARVETLNALKSLREGLVGKILKKSIPQNQQELFKFFTNTNYAVESYMAITMCQETCTDYDSKGKVLYDTTDAVMKTTGLTLSPLFALDDLQVDPTSGTSSSPLVNRERQLPTGRFNSGRIGELDDAMTGVLIDMIWLTKRRGDSPTHRKMEEVLHRGFLPSLMVDYIRKISPGGNNGTYTPIMMKNAESFMPYAFRTVHSSEISSLGIQLASILENFADSSLMRFGSVVQAQAGSLIANEDYMRLITAVDIGHAVINSRADDLGGVVTDSGGLMTISTVAPNVKNVPPTTATRIDNAIRAIEAKFGKILENAANVRTYVQQLPTPAMPVGPS